MKDVLGILPDRWSEGPAKSLGYLPLPEEVAKKVKAALEATSRPRARQSPTGRQVQLQGAGTVSRAPVYQVVQGYKTAHPEVQRRLSIGQGSRAGVKRSSIKRRFGASDAAMSKDEIARWTPACSFCR